MPIKLRYDDNSEVTWNKAQVQNLYRFLESNKEIFKEYVKNHNGYSDPMHAGDYILDLKIFCGDEKE